MEGMNQLRYIVSIYGNVTVKSPTQLIYAKKKFLKSKDDHVISHLKFSIAPKNLQ
jgi:hypothetical protein